MAKSEANTKKENKLKKSFIKEFKAELKKVIWPTPKQLVNNTIAVITIVLILTAIVFVLDIIFDSMNKYGISGIQSYVEEHYNNEESTNEETNEEADTEQDVEDESEETVEDNSLEESETENTTQTSE